MTTLRRGVLWCVLSAAACSPGGGPAGFSSRDGSVDVAMSDALVTVVPRDALPPRDRGPVTLDPDAACATTTADTRRVPVNLLVVLDRSGSMADVPRGGTRSKWASAVAAIQALLTRLDDDLRVGITVFPSVGSPGVVGGYTTPAVSVAPLAMTRMPIQRLLSSTSPTGNTPMACAMDGSMQYFERSTLEGSRNVVLITDGQPTNECTGSDVLTACNPFGPLDVFLRCTMAENTRYQTAVQVSVARGARGTPPVQTYVAGTQDASDTFLSDLAVTGNTGRAPSCRADMTCHYRLGTDSFEDDLGRALDDIRGRALTCEFAVDTDPTRVDPTRVNVNLSGTGVSQQVVPRDVDHRDGWDYSDGMRNVVLYGPACERVRTDPAARVQILFGCPTVTPG